MGGRWAGAGRWLWRVGLAARAGGTGCPVDPGSVFFRRFSHDMDICIYIFTYILERARAYPWMHGVKGSREV